MPSVRANPTLPSRAGTLILTLLLAASPVLAPAALGQEAPPKPALETPPVAKPGAPSRVAPLAVPKGAAPAPAPVPARPPDPPGAAPAPVTEAPPPPRTAAAPAPLPPGTAASDRVTLGFAPGASAPEEEAGRLLPALAARLAAEPKRRLEIRAYAAQGPEGEGGAKRLSLSRALAVRDRLIALGVPRQRMVVFAHGAAVPEGPADRVDLAFGG